NGTGWKPANGTAAWGYSLAMGEGAYSIQSRATDAAGNVEAPGAGITVIADATPPQVVLGALPATPIKPTRNAAGQWTVALSGTVSDPAIASSSRPGSGVKPGSVEVLLRGQGDTAQGNLWQAATINVRTWNLNYTFDQALPDPTGAYTVTVHATDNVENSSGDKTA